MQANASLWVLLIRCLFRPSPAAQYYGPDRKENILKTVEEYCWSCHDYYLKNGKLRR